MLGPVNLNTNETPPSEPFGMTDIEDRLRGPEGEAYRQELLKSLNLIEERLSADLNSGLSREAYEQARQVLAAVASAKEIVLAFR